MTASTLSGTGPRGAFGTVTPACRHASLTVASHTPKLFATVAMGQPAFTFPAMVARRSNLCSYDIRALVAKPVLRGFTLCVKCRPRQRAIRRVAESR